MHYRTRKKTQGSALVLALILVSCVAAAGAAYLQFSVSASRTAASSSVTTKAFYMAEAGLAESFTAVKQGRTGQLGTMLNPVEFGDGVLWVDAGTTDEELVRLTSTAMTGRAIATLTYVVQPVQPLLGVFADEDIEIDQVLMIDGYNSALGSYQEQIPTDFDLADPIPKKAVKLLSTISKEGIPVGCHLGYHNYCTGVRSHASVYGSEGTPEFEAAYAARNDGVVGQLDGWYAQLDGIYEREILKNSSKKTGKDTDPTDPITMMPPIRRHTGEGGVLGSNGKITIEPGHRQLVQVAGNLEPGSSESASTNEQVLVSGASDPRDAAVDLPSVSVPTLPMDPGVVHDGLLPMELASGEHGLDALVVARDAEVILRGPATVVIGQLTLQRGATLTLDTRAGDITIYIKQGMELQEGSATISLTDSPQAMTLQVDAIPSTEEGAPVQLNATSQFFGTIYSPETDLHIGSDFEVFGTVIARKLSFGPGAKLHVDSAGTEGSTAPEIISWRILEIPDTVKGKGKDHFEILGIAKTDAVPMSRGHELDQVTMDIRFIDVTGDKQRYEGLESNFDWANVKKVEKIKRKPKRRKEKKQKKRSK